MKRLIKILVVLIIILAGFKFLGNNKEVIDTKIEKSVKEVETMKVSDLKIQNSKQTSVGYVEAVREYEIKSEVPGKVVAIHATSGEPVTKGTLLIELDHEALDIQVASAQGALISAKANLQKLQNGSRSEDLQILELQLISAKKQLQIMQSGSRTEEKDITRTSLDNTRKSLNDALLVLKKTEDKAVHDEITIKNNSLYTIQNSAISAGRVMTFYLQDVVIEGFTPADCRYNFITSYSVDYGVQCVKAFEAMRSLESLAATLDVNSEHTDYSQQLVLAEGYIEIIQNYLEPTFDAVKEAVGTLSNQTYSTSERATLKNQVLSARSEIETTLNQLSNQKSALETQRLNTALSLANSRTQVNELSSRVVSLEKELIIKESGARNEEIDIQNSTIRQLELQVQIAKNGARSEDVSAQSGLVEQARANARSASLQRDKALIKAPYNGTLLTTPLKEGQLVTTNQVIGYFASSDQLSVKSHVSEEEATYLQVGDSVTIEAPHGYIEAIISEISGFIDPETKKIKVTITPKQSTKKLTLGSTVRVVYTKNTEITKVPLTSIMFEGENVYIYSVKEGVVTKEKVVLGDILGQFVEITSEVSLDLNIILDARNVQPEEKVTIKNTFELVK